MSKVLDFMEKQTNDKGETVYTYRSILGQHIKPPATSSLKNDPEASKVEIIEIAGNIRYLDCRVANYFPNLKKIIVQPITQRIPSSLTVLSFGHGAFMGCPNLLAVELYRPICFVNHDSLHWKKPFSDSNNVTFIYNIDDIKASQDEINRWNIPYRDATKQAKTSTPNRGLRRMGLFK